MEKFQRNWSFVKGNPLVSGKFPEKKASDWALILSSICAWTNGWASNRGGGDLIHHLAHYGVIVMWEIIGVGGGICEKNWIVFLFILKPCTCVTKYIFVVVWSKTCICFMYPLSNWPVTVSENTHRFTILNPNDAFSAVRRVFNLFICIVVLSGMSWLSHMTEIIVIYATNWITPLHLRVVVG